MFLGDILYAFLAHKYAILTSRFISGIGAGTLYSTLTMSYDWNVGIQAVAFNYMSGNTTPTERTTKLSYYYFVGSVSFVFGPGNSKILFDHGFIIL
jgi:hypothetical protein